MAMLTLRNAKREMRKLSFKGYNYISSIYIIIYHYAPDTHCRIANLRKVEIANLQKTKGKKIAFREILLTLRRNVLIETLQKCKINGKNMKNDVGVQRLGVSVLLINFKTFQRLFVNC